MSNLVRTLMLVFAAGALGGAINAVTVWAAGEYGVTDALNVRIAPDLTKEMLYARVTWGGIWGGVFVLPALINGWPIKRWWVNGIVLSLLPSAVTLFYLMPSGPAGMMGLDKGTLTPLCVFVFNAVWGLTGMLALRFAGHSGGTAK